MLRLAVQAQLPLIAVTTRDTLNLPEVIEEITGKKPVEFKPELAGKTFAPGKLYMLIATGAKLGVALPKLYETMTKAECTLLIVNAANAEEAVFDAGEVPVPKSLLMKFMMAVTKNQKKSEELLRGLGGCTIKEAVELCRMTMARDKSLTPAGIMQTRKTSFQGSKGLTHVDTAQTFYDPPKPLQQFIKREKSFFLAATDPRLRTRGLLMDGPPGTGKTAASKWIATQLGVPLYRLDMGGVKNKYLGASEGNMLANLARIEHEEPAVLLIDEVEKVFNQGQGNVDGGTTTTMMSQLLWWLAEHNSRILTVMTTNNVKAIPPELYREGRIDEVMYFGGLDESEAFPFVASVLQTFGVKDDAVMDAIVNHEFGKTEPGKKISQAVLTQAVVKALKNGVAKKALAL